MTKKIFITVFLLTILIFLLGLVFSGKIILPQLIQLGPITIRYYGIFMALAVATGFYIALKRAQKFGLAKKQAEDIVFWLIAGGFIGARLYHVLSSWSFYYQNPADILKVWNGGLSIYGVIFGGIISLIIAKKVIGYKLFVLDRARRDRSVISLLNWLTPSLILGQVIGRFGNLFNYELFGYPTDLFWKMFVPEGFRPERFQNNFYFHPLFLYEQLGLIAVFLIIRQLEKNKPAPVLHPGSNAFSLSGVNLFLWYLLLYNVLRFGLEFLRIDSVFWHGIRFNALVSLLLAIFASLMIYVRVEKNHNI